MRRTHGRNRRTCNCCSIVQRCVDNRAHAGGRCARLGSLQSIESVLQRRAGQSWIGSHAGQSGLRYARARSLHRAGTRCFCRDLQGSPAETFGASLCGSQEPCYGSKDSSEINYLAPLWHNVAECKKRPMMIRRPVRNSAVPSGSSGLGSSVCLMGAGHRSIALFFAAKMRGPLNKRD